MHSYPVRLTVLALAVCLLTASMALAQGVRERQAERKPTIDRLLAEGTIGINNIGLLEYMGKELHMPVVKAENEDRVIIYKAIAKRVDKTINDVGAKLAVKMHQRAPSGTWLQSDAGKWYRKP